MPIYDYVCESCGHTVEVMHGISAPGPAACERCGGTMKRALSAPAIVFKGSGWAKKDARDASRPKAASTTASSDATSTGSTAAEATGGETSTAASGSDSTTSSAPATASAKPTGGSGAAAG